MRQLDDPAQNADIGNAYTLIVGSIAFFYFGLLFYFRLCANLLRNGKTGMDIDKNESRQAENGGNEEERGG